MVTVVITWLGFIVCFEEIYRGNSVDDSNVRRNDFKTMDFIDAKRRKHGAVDKV